MEHSRFAPSAMYRLVECYGSVALSQGIDEPETEEQREGTAAHWVGTCMLTYGLGVPEHFIGLPAPNGIIITEDMYDAALVYFKAVRSVTGPDPLHYLQIEQPLVNVMNEIHPECWGTPDSWYYHDGDRILHIWDFKYGFVRVAAYENWQLICYALGALNQLTGQGLTGNQIKVKFHVVQPRCYDGQGSELTHLMVDTDLRVYVNIMHLACKMADTSSVVRAGEHCIGCPARHVCSASMGATAQMISYSATALPVVMSPEGLSFELQLIDKAEKLLKYRKEAMTQEALRRLHEGKQIPGWMMEPGQGHNDWSDPGAAIAFGQVLGIDLMEHSVLTPAKVKKELARRNIDENIIAPLMVRPKTAMRLKFDDGSKAQRIFSTNKI